MGVYKFAINIMLQTIYNGVQIFQTDDLNKKIIMKVLDFCSTIDIENMNEEIDKEIVTDCKALLQNLFENEIEKKTLEELKSKCIIWLNKINS